MERGKAPSTRGKAKTQHFPSDLFALGSKSSGSDASKRSLPSGSTERKREAPVLPLGGSKKAKTITGGPTPLGRPSSSSPSTTTGAVELWETQATDVEASELVDTVLETYQAGHFDKAANLICGGLKALKNNRWKPDTVLTLGLIYLAKLKPSLFASENVTQALSVLLKRDPQHNLKSKGNPTVSVLAANLLARGYHDTKHWPTSFIKLYIEDAMGERVWVDQAECKGFVNNLLTGFGTKVPPASLNFLFSEIGGIGGMNRADSPLTISLDDEDDNAGGVLDVPVLPRFSSSTDIIEQIILDIQGSRRQTPESITRNYLKLLGSAAGIVDVRVFASSRLELWLQNPKLMKPAQELLLSICLNCCTHTQKDIQVIGSIVKIRLKTKAVINFYLSCIRQLINAHPENLSTLLKHTIYNELSNSRNPNNMAMIGVVFQCQPEESAMLLADVFLELLINRDDYLRPLRVLLREIVRVLRHDINLVALCRGLMVDKRDNQTFRDFEFKERMFCAIVDLVTHACFVGVSPGVKEALNLVARGDKREIQTLVNFHTIVSTIEQEAVLWLKDLSIKVYRPSPVELVHALSKLVFMEPPETYAKVDMWPPESERALLYRLATGSPLYETTLFTILVIGLSKEHPVTSPDALELADQMVKRAAAAAANAGVASGGSGADPLPMLTVTRLDLFDVVFKATAYHHPDNISLPQGYSPPRLAISNCYWKAWVMLLVVSAHNPTTLGACGWEKYPTLRMLMEMCITNHFSYPPPTMLGTESAEDTKMAESRITQIEREQILEFEKHLAAASTKATITEATSLLLPQLITMDPTGPSRKPPPAVLEQLTTLNSTHRLGHLLCRSRHPDFLLDLIQRQGASQSMPWLADLVENSESSLSHLPLQCLCEFLLTSGPPEKQSKGQQLVTHLQQVLTSPDQEATAPCEVVEYLLRRLSSPNMNSRLQAIKGLKLVVSVTEESQDMPEYLQESAWLLQHLPLLPHFDAMRPQVVAALRQACQVENDPSCIASYIQFLAVHTSEETLTSLGLLVQDMAQLIVERSTIMNAVMPDVINQEALRKNTQHSLLLIFFTYLEKLRQPGKDTFQWSESSDQVLVTWATGEEATLHILVIQAMIILLSHGIGNDPALFEHMLNIWFPLTGEQPHAYLIDTSEEALMIPDWLKLRMIRSGVSRLVNAALVDLAPQQLVLFIQSFGIPVSSMSCLLEALDNSNPNMLLATNFDKAYMTQLVTVQRRRGATGGQRFLQTFADVDHNVAPPAFKAVVTKPQLILKPTNLAAMAIKFDLPLISALFKEVLAKHGTRVTRRKAFDRLQQILLFDAKLKEKVEAFSIILQHLMAMVQDRESLKVLIEDPATSCLLVRLLWTQIQSLPLGFKLQFVSYVKQISLILPHSDAALTALLTEIVKTQVEQKPKMKMAPRMDTIMSMLDGATANIGKVIDHLVATEPELIGINTENEMRMLLFGKPVKSETAGGVMETCRPYLLTLLTHRASWDRLRTLVDHLLSQHHPFYSSTAVLDFLEAMTHNPRLWQGREKHVPKHHQSEPILNLTEKQVSILVEYFVEEAQANDVTTAERPVFLDKLESRLPLLLESLNEDFFPEIVKEMGANGENTARGKVYQHLLILLYYHVPALVQHLVGTEKETLLKEASISGWSSSVLDKMSHSLLTALTSITWDKEDQKRSHEYELSARKMAKVHPGLVLRQLPMLASSLVGRVHLDYHVLKTRNHLNIFTQVLGLMELLQPRIFDKTYKTSLHSILDAYLNLYRLHGHMNHLIHTVARFIALLQNYVVHEATIATKFLQSNAHYLLGMQKRHPKLSSLRSLLSGVLTAREDGEEAEGQSVVVATPTELVTTPPSTILAALNRNQGEDLLSTLQDLEHLSQRNPAILNSVAEQITDLIMSPYSNIRTVAHTLLARLFKLNPECNALTGYLRCLESGQGDIVQSALEKLPEIVVSSQENAVLLLEKAFSLGVRSNLSTHGYISKAIAMLNQQAGC